MASMVWVSRAPAKRSPGVLRALDHGDGHDLLGEVGVDVEHAGDFLAGLGLVGVGRVPFLPEELGGAQEEAGPHLPAADVGPLVDEEGQIAVALDPVAVLVPDDGLRGGADDQGLGELRLGVHHHGAVLALEAVVGHHGALLGEALGVFLFLGQEAQGDEEREVGVHVPRGLEAVVELALHLLPDAVAVRADDHAAAHGRVLGQLRLLDDVLVPLPVVLFAAGDAVHGLAFVLAHG